MRKASIFNIFLLLLSTALVGQSASDTTTHIPIEIGPWEGKAYHLITQINKRYYPGVEEETPFTSVHYDNLHIGDRAIEQGFPQVDKKSSFGMILYAELVVPESGTFGFKLSSDDGSKLWIGKTRVIDNDGPHGFKSKANRICLSAGRHPIKVWYYQGWPTRFGLDLECVRLDKECLEPLEPLYVERSPRFKSEEEETPKEHAKAIAEASKFFDDPVPILFDHWKSDILPEYESVIADIKSQIARLDNVIIRIEGHTDDTGNDQLNLDLSRARAEAIMQAIYSVAAQNNNRIQSVGFGADRPVASNNDESGRRRNRRVEVKIIQQDQPTQ